MKLVFAMLLLFSGCAYKNGEIFHDMLTRQDQPASVAFMHKGDR